MLGPLARDEAADAGPGDLHVRYVEQRRPIPGQPEQPFESECEVEIAARVEPALGEGVEPGEPALAQCDPGGRVAPDDDIGLAGGRWPHLAPPSAGADLPRPADVAKPDLECRVEVVLGAQVAGGQGSERLLHTPDPLLVQGNAAPDSRAALRCLPRSLPVAHRSAGRYPSEWPRNHAPRPSSR